MSRLLKGNPRWRYLLISWTKVSYTKIGWVKSQAYILTTRIWLKKNFIYNIKLSHSYTTCSPLSNHEPTLHKYHSCPPLSSANAGGIVFFATIELQSYGVINQFSIQRFTTSIFSFSGVKKTTNTAAHFLTPSYNKIA